MSTFSNTPKKSALEQFADASVQRAAAKARRARLAELREEDLETEIIDELPIDIEFDDVEDAIEGIMIVRANRMLRGVS